MHLIPQVKELRLNSGCFILHSGTSIIVSNHSLEAALSLQSFIVSTLNFHLRISTDASTENRINLKYGDRDSESYSISIDQNNVTIQGDGPKGVFYGVQTLKQIILNVGMKLPCLTIEDYPDFMIRGFYHDVTRGKVPKLKTLKMIADRLAFYKINHFQLYFEHTYAFKDLPDLWIDKDPLTADEIRELDTYCKSIHVDLVPSIATFGHLYELLRLKRFTHLNELDIDASELSYNLWDRMAHYTLDVSQEESFELVKDMINEILPNFSSQYFNICCDETFDLGKGKNKQKADAQGTATLYVNFVKKLIDVVESHGKTPMLWGDIVLKYPEYIKEIPSNAIMLNWGYDADVTPDSTRIFAELNVTQLVCPGTNGWSRFANDINVASVNIRKMVSYGKAYSSLGILNTDWGDCGHVNLLGNSKHSLIFGAALSWNATSFADDNQFELAVSKLEWNDNTGKTAQLLRELGSLCPYHFGNLYAWAYDIKGKWDREDYIHKIAPEEVKQRYLKATQIANGLAFIRQSENEQDFNEFVWSAKAIAWTLALIAWKQTHTKVSNSFLLMNSSELFNESFALANELKDLWRMRNKESELRRVIAIFKKVAEKLWVLDTKSCGSKTR